VDAVAEKPVAKDGKLVLAEEKVRLGLSLVSLSPLSRRLILLSFLLGTSLQAEGRVSRQAINLLISSLGGWVFWIVVLSSIVLDQFLVLAQTWWLGQWANQYDPKHPEDASNVSVSLFKLNAIEGTSGTDASTALLSLSSGQVLPLLLLRIGPRWNCCYVYWVRCLGWRCCSKVSRVSLSSP